MTWLVFTVLVISVVAELRNRRLQEKLRKSEETVSLLLVALLREQEE